MDFVLRNFLPVYLQRCKSVANVYDVMLYHQGVTNGEPQNARRTVTAICQSLWVSPLWTHLANTVLVSTTLNRNTVRFVFLPWDS